MYAYISSPQLVWTKIHLQITIQIKNHPVFWVVFIIFVLYYFIYHEKGYYFCLIGFDVSIMYAFFFYFLFC